MQIRYHLDESVNHAIACGLRQRGIDVFTSTDAGLLGASDRRQLAFALQEDRVVVTHDDDFLRLAASGELHAGITYCHQDKLTIGQLVNVLADLWRTRTAKSMVGVVEFLS